MILHPIPDFAFVNTTAENLFKVTPCLAQKGNFLFHFSVGKLTVAGKVLGGHTTSQTAEQWLALFRRCGHWCVSALKVCLQTHNVITKVRIQ